MKNDENTTAKQLVDSLAVEGTLRIALQDCYDLLRKYQARYAGTEQAKKHWAIGDALLKRVANLLTVKTAVRRGIEAMPEDLARDSVPALKGNYILQPAPQSHCDKCDETMWWLCPYNGSQSERWFLICFKCEHIAEAGVGAVRKEIRGNQ